jgi:hypothetical protein
MSRMPDLTDCTVHCPYCGEALELVVDASAGTQHYVEDCAVCCRPMEVAVEVDADGAHVAVRHENET